MKKILILSLISLFYACQSTSESKMDTGILDTGTCSKLDEGHKAVAPHAMIVSNGPESTRLGLEVLKKGGNAVDAAVVVSLALGVELPEASGMGGGGLMLLSMKGKKTFWDYRERAPHKATQTMYENAAPDNNSQVGPLSVAVPGLLNGLYTIHKKYGKLKWKDLVLPVAALADKGVKVHAIMAAQIPKFIEGIKSDPEMSKIYLDAAGASRREGDIIKLPAMAKTLRKVAALGPKAIYEGEFAISLIKKLGPKGILSLQDLKDYKTYESPVLKSQYGAYTLYSAPSPSSGGIVMAQLFSQLNNIAQIKSSATKMQYLTELMKLSYWDRAAYMGDSRFVNVPVEKLLSDEYLKAQYARVDPDKALKLEVPVEVGTKGTDTTHFNIVDKDGNAVSSTQTHNYWFGSKIMHHGITLNDEMDDFALKPGVANVWGLIGSYKNAIAPGKTPLTSMTPTLIEKDGKFFMAIGGRGGGQIISATYEVLSQIIADGKSAENSIEACRYHHQAFPNVVNLEKGFNPTLVEVLKEKGHQEDFPERWTGKVTLIEKTPDGYLGLADPREIGKALGN